MLIAILVIARSYLLDSGLARKKINVYGGNEDE